MAQEHLDTAQLLAIYKEGDAHDRASIEHLVTCAECQQSFDDSRWLLLLRRLRGIVETGSHPSADELAAYRSHALSSRSVARVERHLRSCDRCAAAYRRDRIVDRQLAYSSPPPSLLKRAQRKFRPRPLLRLGTVIVRRLGEKLRLAYLPRELETFSAGAPIMDEAALEDESTLRKAVDIPAAIPKSHPGSASRRKSRKDPPIEIENVLSACSDGRLSAEPGAPSSVRIPAADWEIELVLRESAVSLRLSSRKDASVEGIRMSIARKGQDPSEAVTDSDGRTLLSLGSGTSEITIHADPPFALDLRFLADT